MRRAEIQVGLLIVLFFTFLIAGCSSKYSARQSVKDSTPPSIQGRWLMNGQAGKSMIKAVNRADSSIIIMSRAFVIKENSVTERLANRLIERSRDGVTVSILLPKNFISYFDKMNQQTSKRFEGTPVDLKLQQTRGSFGTNQQFNGSSAGTSDGYVSSAVFLVDGSVFFTGNFILAPDNLSTDNSTMVQFRGPEVYEKVMPIVSPVLDQHNLDTGMSDPTAVVEQPTTGGWSPVKDFSFHLGRSDMNTILHQLFATADTTVRMSVWTAGNLTSEPVKTVLEPLLSWERRLSIDEAEIYYSDCMGKLCAVHTWVDRQYEAYNYQEEKDQYQRFGLIDKERFYAGTYDLWTASLWGRHYETLVTGYSKPMVSRMTNWLESHRERAKPVHQEWKRFSVFGSHSSDRDEERSSTKKRQSVKSFIHETVMPVVNNNRWDTFVRIIDKDSAQSVAWDIYSAFKKNLQQDTGEPGKILSEFEEQYGVQSYNEARLTDKKLLDAILRNLVQKHSYFSVIARQTVFEYLREVTGGIQSPYLVEYENGYRLYQTGRTVLDGDFKWTVWFMKQSGQWKLILR